MGPTSSICGDIESTLEAYRYLVSKEIMVNLGKFICFLLLILNKVKIAMGYTILWSTGMPIAGFRASKIRSRSLKASSRCSSLLAMSKILYNYIDLEINGSWFICTLLLEPHEEALWEFLERCTWSQMSTAKKTFLKSILYNQANC